MWEICSLKFTLCSVGTLLHRMSELFPLEDTKFRGSASLGVAHCSDLSSIKVNCRCFGVSRTKQHDQTRFVDRQEVSNSAFLLSWVCWWSKLPQHHQLASAIVLTQSKPGILHLPWAADTCSPCGLHNSPGAPAAQAQPRWRCRKSPRWQTACLGWRTAPAAGGRSPRLRSPRSPWPAGSGRPAAGGSRKTWSTYFLCKCM